MLFNSFSFLIFIQIVFALYWLLNKKKLIYQNILLLISSYYFYSCWNWKFLFLLIFSTLLDYYSGLKIQNSIKIKEKKLWLWISIVINLGFLGVFKYYNFFIESFTELLNTIGFHLNPSTIDIILPVGISFYTFHGLSYVIDIYNDKIKAEKNFIYYAVFVCFFPLLVAGPIERATHLLPQIKKRRIFNYYMAIDGLKQILWGMFKKVVIADNCATFANDIFNNQQDYNGSTLFLGAIFFSFQIYGDFSGYSDIALGTARLFGINLLKNFSFPYFSRDIAEFWRRWHISLSSWFKDYLYIPLGGSNGGKAKRIRNTFIIFLVSGFWHGANWTFIFWGAVNAFFFLPLLLSDRNRHNIDIVAKGRLFPNLSEIISIFITFFLVVNAWIFFRSDNLESAFTFIIHTYSINFLSIPSVKPYYLFCLLFFFFIIEWLGRENNYALERLFNNKPRIMRWLFYSFIIFLICMFIKTEETPFIYFQF
jgi:D-alanyl-lipoteichoic acid acyltransferase DltB (MBOAT superfamily)